MRKVFYIASIVVILTLIGIIWLTISRQDKTKVNVQVQPTQAQVTINGRSVGTGNHYLKPGDYTFKASLEGWKADTQILKIDDKPRDVILLPEPDSLEARNYLRENPEVQLKREKLGGEKFNNDSQATAESNPIISILPNTEPSGPFSIDYGPSSARKDGIFLLVSDSTANGRINSLKWLRNQGYDPTDLEIRFYDFTNPLYGSEARE